MKTKGYGGDPKVGYPLDDVVAFLEIWFTQLVVLLLDLEDLVACLLVEPVDLILTTVDLLEGLLYLQVKLPRFDATLAGLLEFLQFLCRGRHAFTTTITLRGTNLL